MSFPRLTYLLLPLVLGLPLLVGACGAPLAVTGASYGADGVSFAETGKSTTDHFASMVSKKDCALWRVFRNQDICRERGGQDPYKVDYNTPNRTSSDSGVEYEAPAKSGSDSPAFAWDASAYKQTSDTPAPGTARGPVTADATPQPAAVATATASSAYDATPPQPAAAAPAKSKKPVHARSPEPKKKKKPVAASATPPSQDQAAPAL
ncbi:MAG: hypothetical protein JOY81_13025 [Alphaproteobacteria bacterium]|nr:hypothetical protein [Alphaproteobacteria bacterium]